MFRSCIPVLQGTGRWSGIRNLPPGLCRRGRRYRAERQSHRRRADGRHPGQWNRGRSHRGRRKRDRNRCPRRCPGTRLLPSLRPAGRYLDQPAVALVRDQRGPIGEANGVPREIDIRIDTAGAATSVGPEHVPRHIDLDHAVRPCVRGNRVSVMMSKPLMPPERWSLQRICAAAGGDPAPQIAAARKHRSTQRHISRESHRPW